MRTPRRAASTAWTLFVGGARNARRRIPWRARREAIESADVVSFDIFDTVLLKAPGFDRRVLAAVTGRVRGGSADLPAEPASVRSALSRAHRELAAEAIARGADPAVSRRALYEAFFRSLRAAPPESGVDELLRHELELHRDLTTPNPEILEVVELSRSLGKRVIAVSDTYFGADELARLLRMHECPPFDAIYASCDVGYSKFRGGLFDHVLAQEGVAAEKVLHIGDDRLADVYSPGSRGIPGVRYRRKGRRSADGRDFRLGFDVLGPIFASFCHLLLLETRRNEVSRLAFIARDGEFLKEATDRLMAASPFLPRPRLDYVFLSRRATALPARSRLDRSALAEVEGIRAEGRIEDLFFEYFGLDRSAFPALAARAGTRSLGELLEDGGFRDFVEVERARQRALLADYLRQEGLFGGGGFAFVDVGWRGSTQRSLGEAFAADPGFVPPRFFYLALWSEYGPIPNPGGSALGLLGDQRRSRRMRESAAWHLAFLIEAVCRASHGTVAGFERDQTGAVRPRFAEESEGRRAEAIAEKSQDAIRKGILSYIDGYGAGLGRTSADEKRLRRRAQRRMLRLAFFPRRWEIDAVSGMVQTEGHASDWSATLVSPDRVHPLRSPRRWMAGLTSPWRGGYVAATGGYPLALAFFGLELLLNAVPPRIRRRLREWALKSSVVKIGPGRRQAS